MPARSNRNRINSALRGQLLRYLLNGLVATALSITLFCDLLWKYLACIQRDWQMVLQLYSESSFLLLAAVILFSV